MIPKEAVGDEDGALRMALMFIDAGRNMGGSIHGQHFERIGLATLMRCLSGEKA